MEEEINLSRRFLVKFIIFLISALGTYTLSAVYLHNAVISSAIIGLVISFFPGMLSISKSKLQAIGFSGSFAGMCSADLILAEIHFVIMAIIGAILFILLDEKYQGLGGKLGMIAFISVFSTLFIRGSIF